MNKRSNNHFLIITVSAILIFAIIGFIAPAMADYGDYEYSVSDGKSVITVYKGTNSKVIIPSEIGGHPVAGIGEFAFFNHRNLTDIKIPGSVTVIGKNAFAYCEALKQVTLPSALMVIGDEAFRNCESLAGFAIPANVDKIGNNAFWGCQNLKSFKVSSKNKSYASVNGVLYDKGRKTLLAFPAGKKSDKFPIPKSITNITDGAFSYCQVTSVTVPNSVKSIGEEAFAYCMNLIHLDLPGSVTDIGRSIVIGCNKMTRLDVSEDNTFFASMDGVLYNKNMTVLITCPAGKTGNSFAVLESVTKIGFAAFCGCTFTNITLPTGLTNVEDNAFLFCKNLTEIHIPDSVASLGFGTFSSCESLKNVTLPQSLVSIGDSLFKECHSLTGITIPAGVTSIGDAAFFRCEDLTSIAIPDNVEGIGDWAFFECTNLKTAAIPSSVKNIGIDVFTGCSTVTIYGKTGSYAQIYAQDNGIAFETGYMPSIISGYVYDGSYSYGKNVTIVHAAVTYKDTTVYTDSTGKFEITISDDSDPLLTIQTPEFHAYTENVSRMINSGFYLIPEEIYRGVFLVLWNREASNPQNYLRKWDRQTEFVVIKNGATDEQVNKILDIFSTDQYSKMTGSLYTSTLPVKIVDKVSDIRSLEGKTIISFGKNIEKGGVAHSNDKSGVIYYAEITFDVNQKVDKVILWHEMVHTVTAGGHINEWPSVVSETNTTGYVTEIDEKILNCVYNSPPLR